MTFHTNRHNYARFRTYGDAKLYFDNTKPIRGQDKDLVGVPLRDNRKYWQAYSLRKKGDDYAVRMHNTDIAVFKPDGTTIIDVSYNSNSTNEVASNFTPRAKSEYYFYPLRRNNRVLMAGNHQAFWANKPIIFKDGEIINKEQLAVEKSVLNRKRAKAVRAKLQPFMEYIKTMRALSEPDGLSSAALPPWEGPMNSYDRDYTDPNNFPRLLRPYWVNHWRFYGGQNGEQRARIRDDAEKTILLAAYKREDAYDWKPLEEGTTHKTMRYVVWNEPNL